MDTSDILDWQDALTRSANKPDLAAKLIIMMLDTINEEKQALTQAWEARDRNLLAQIAHRILGGSRYTGVPQLRQASQDLEDKCLLNVQHTTPVQFAMIEPYYEALLTALNNLQNVKIFNVALGEKNNSVFFSNKRSDDLNSVSITEQGEEISLCKLDDLPINESKINLMKIDVLGYEKFVFGGAKKILKITECIHLPIIPSDCKRYGYDFNDIFEMLRNLGFQLFTFSEKNISVIKSNFNSKSQDILAVKDLEGFLTRTKYTLVK